jgi:beta-lactam-binding protein with PASTA domain
MDFFRFLFSKRFLKHLLLAVVTTAALLTVTMMFLSWYTGHGNFIVVPDLRGRLVEDARADGNNGDFELVVIDSAYEMGVPPGTILTQDPSVNSKVKHNRKIYLTVVSSVPDKVAMPDLKFLTLRQASSMLESMGLKLGTISYTRSFDEDAIQQQYFEGKPVRPGTKIFKGSIIDLVVGLGSKGLPQNSPPSPGEEIDDTTSNEL